MSYTEPVPASINAAINRNLYITFSEAMDPSTMIGANITVMQDATPIAGAITYVGTTVTFDPTVNLPINVPITVTVTTGAKDLTGNPLASNFVSMFTTGSTSAAGPEPVVLGLAGNYAIMAKTAITTSGVTAIVGDLGLNPAAESYLEGFGQARDISNMWSTSSLVTGKIYTSDMAAPTPGNIVLATADMEIAFTDAANRTTPDYTELYSGDISGRTLSPGLYKWGTGVLITSGVTLTGGANDIWIFQIAGNLTVGNGAIVTLSGGAQAKNIFWQVSGGVDLGTTSKFKGNILCQTLIAMNTGGSLSGRALAQTAVTLLANSVTADMTRPAVTSTSIANGATGVSINTHPGVFFTEAMDPLTINSATFTVKQGVTPVAGTMSYTGVSAIFTPASPLLPDTTYTCTITGQAMDLAGNMIESDYVWTWTTGSVPDITAPTVSYTAPLNAAVDVGINQNINVTFSEVMDPLTITTTTFTLKQGTTPVAGTVIYVGNTAIFNPTVDLTANTAYTGTITTAATDLAGNPISEIYVLTFTTGATVNIIRPTVTVTVPANNAINVPVNTQLGVFFSEAMDPLTLNTTTVTLKQGATPVAGTVTYSGVSAVFTPSSTLALNTVYTGTITTGAADVGGNTLLADYVWTWTTGSTPDTTAPGVTGTAHANGSTGVPVNVQLSVYFNEAMNPLTINNTTFTLKHGTTVTAGTVSYLGVAATFIPSANLESNTLYTGTITTGAEDLSENALASNYVWSWTTGSNPDTTDPTVTATTHANGATGVPLNMQVGAFMSEPMDPLTVTTTTFTLHQGTTQISGTVTYSGVVATFTPTASLAPNTMYTCRLTTGAKDLAGNALQSDYIWSWTTGASPDTTRPSVTATTHANGATGVPVNMQVGAFLSEAMDPLTITNNTFTLKQAATPIAGVVSYIGTVATFTPSAPLAYNTTYTSTITTGVKDLAGNALASDYVWSWTTGGAPDITSPAVSATANVNGATDVPVNTKIGAFFTEAMDPLTINTTTFFVKQGTTTIAGTVSYTGLTATFTPAAMLAYNTSYTCTLSTGAKDLAGNATEDNYIWTWTTGPIPDTIRPTITGTLTANGAAGVPVNAKVSAFFTEAMDPATITANTFTLKHGTTSVSGSVSYIGVTATFAPLTTLAYDTTYTATITSEAKDLAGNALQNTYAWSWTTGSYVDAVAPTVSHFDPSQGTTNVATNQNISVIFSEVMDPATITTATFLIMRDDSEVRGAVTYLGTTATFNPTDDLNTNQLYTATVNISAKDLAGNTLDSAHVWSFTTGENHAAGPAPVNLGTAGTFVVLAKAAVTTTGATTIVGNMGLSPAAESYITGFSLIRDSANEWATSSQVTGKIYAADMAPPTPANMTTAIGDMEIAFTDAANRTTPDYTELYSGDISGRTLSPGLYKWGTGVLITNGVTLAGGANDIWIFQIAEDLTVENGAIVTLSGGAQAKNVFWQISGQATLGTTSQFKGIILSQTMIAMNTGAVLDGRALAQTSVTLDANTVIVTSAPVSSEFTIDIATDRAVYATGDSMSVTISTSGGNENFDAYIAVLLSTGDIFCLVIDPASGAVVLTDAVDSIVSNSAPLTLVNVPIYHLSVLPQLPQGDYLWAFVLTRPGADVMNSENWLASDFAPFMFE